MYNTPNKSANHSGSADIRAAFFFKICEASLGFTEAYSKCSGPTFKTTANPYKSNKNSETDKIKDVWDQEATEARVVWLLLRLQRVNTNHYYDCYCKRKNNYQK